MRKHAKYVYVCDVVVYNIQVYSELYSLHQIVYQLQVTSLHYVNIVYSL